jgi:hypothetical protein
MRSNWKTARSDLMSKELDWDAIFRQRPDLAPPGYHEAVEQAQQDSELKYERLGRRRAGKSGRSKSGQFPGLKHGAD